MQVPQYMRECLQRIRRGPSISPIPGGPELTKDEITKRYQQWYKTWIEQDLTKLFPEMKEWPNP